MPKTYKISEENAAEIKEIRKTIINKKVDKRLHAVQLRGEGLTNHEIAEKLDTSDKMVSQWVSAYINKERQQPPTPHFYMRYRGLLFLLPVGSYTLCCRKAEQAALPPN